MGSRSWSDQQLSAAVESNHTLADVCREIGLVPRGGNYKSLKIHIRRLCLDTTHMLGRAHARGTKQPSRARYSLDEILVKNSTYTNMAVLKERLLKAGLLKYRCAVCEISEWLGNSLSLHLDHINGHNTDHRLRNLRLLCPNCHSQTSTYCGRATKKPKTIHHCPCGKKVSTSGARCRRCAGRRVAQHKIEWPSTKKLLKMVEATSFLAVGAKLGVSDNAVRKRLRTRGALEGN